MGEQGCTQKQIALAIDKDKPVICRELKRNVNHSGRYSFTYAYGMASFRKELMKKPGKLNSWLKKEIIGLIKQEWSPQQIEGRLNHENKPSVCHETIYKIIRQDRTDGGNLYRHKLKYQKRNTVKKITVRNRITTDRRPKIVDTKQRLGDWETDTIMGKNSKGAILTVVEKKQHL